MFFLFTDIYSFFIEYSFLEHKTNEYIYGQWASYKFESNIEYIVMMAVYSFVFLYSFLLISLIVIISGVGIVVGLLILCFSILLFHCSLFNLRLCLIDLCLAQEGYC